MKMTHLISAIAVITLGLLVGCSMGSAQQEGEQAPQFTLSDINGSPVSLSQFGGKVVILDFFADWCPPCRQEIPDFIALQNEFGPQGLAVVGVAVVPKEDAARFAAEMKINYPVLVDDGQASNAYGPIRSIPTTFIIDRSGKIIKKYIGFRPKEVFAADIGSLL